jgi:hypothetical protein
MKTCTCKTPTWVSPGNGAIYCLVCGGQKGREDWRTIEAQSQADLEAIQTDQDAIAFIEKSLSRERCPDLLKIYRSDRHEMNRTPREAIGNLPSLPPF